MTPYVFKIFLLMYRHLGVQIIFLSHGMFLLEKVENNAGDGI